MKKIFYLTFLIMVVGTLTACASGSKSDVKLGKTDSELKLTFPGPNPQLNKAPKDGTVSGLVTGIWHGIISPGTLLVSFFKPEIQMYDVYNTGPLYNLGFLIGMAIIFLVLGFSGGRRR
jgi:hypothetical protein